MNPSEYIREHPVLYVDDESANRIVFEAAYGDEFEIVTAASGREALERLESLDAAVLVTDFRMPGMNGVELCEQVRERYPHIRRVMATAFSDQRTAVAAINKGGVQRYIEKPLQPSEVRGALRDCIAEVHLERTREQLREAIVERERVAALSAARASLLHDVGNMSSAVSACASNLRALMSSRPDAVPSDVREELQDLLEAVGYLVQLHEETHRIGKTQSRHFEPVPVDEVMRTAARLVERRKPRAPKIVVEASTARAYVDRVDFNRIVVNLLGNAVDAIIESGIDDGEIRLRATQFGERVYLLIIDNGPGIPAAHRDRVFDLHFTTRASSGGSGLGLPICAELAEANGGTVHISERPQPRGTTLIVSLPTGPADAAPRRLATM